MQNQFEFEFNGRTVKTGMKTPETRPLGNPTFPTVDLLSLDDIFEIASNPDRVAVWEDPALSRNLNQGRLSSCNLYAAARLMTVTGHYQGLKPIQYAPEFNYHLITGGRDEGSLLPDGMNSIMTDGMPEYGKYPNQRCDVRPSPEARQSASQNKLLEVNQMPNRSVEEHWQAMISSVARRQSIVTAVHVGRNYMQVDQAGIVGFDRGPGNHAVCGSDFRINPRLNGARPRSWEDVQLWHDGSWGEDYGRGGGGFFTIQHSIEPMRWHATYGGRVITRTGGPNAQ